MLLLFIHSNKHNNNEIIFIMKCAMEETGTHIFVERFFSKDYQSTVDLKNSLWLCGSH